MYVLLIDNFFQSGFRFTAKLKGQYRFSIYSLPTHCSNTNNIVSEWFICYISEPTLICHHHQKFTVYVKVHSGYCTFYEFWQMYSDFVSIIILYRIVSLPPKYSGLHYFSRSSTPPYNHWSFYYLHSFALSRRSYSWNHIVYSLTDWLLSLGKYILGSSVSELVNI